MMMTSGMPMRAAAVALVLLAGSSMPASSLADTPAAGPAPAPASNSTNCKQDLLFQKLYVLMPAINQCALESDYFIRPDTLAMPSDENLNRFCRSKNCSNLSLELEDAGLPSCTVPVGNETMSFKLFFRKMKDHCNSTKTALPSSDGDSPAAFNPTRVLVLALMWALFFSVMT